jgi:hypothetical protein
MPTEIRVTTDDNELSLEQLSWAMPDTSVVMVRIGENWWRLIFSARGGNWPLAEYYLRRVRKLENVLATLRPKHAERLARFQEEALPAVEAAIAGRDAGGLESAFAAATDMANRMHVESGYPYIKWVLPATAPPGLDLGPVVAAPADVAHDHDDGAH